MDQAIDLQAQLSDLTGVDWVEYEVWNLPHDGDQIGGDMVLQNGLYHAWSVISGAVVGPFTVELETKSYYSFAGMRVAMRVVSASANEVFYLHGDHPSFHSGHV